jgi:hypothetical protein
MLRWPRRLLDQWQPAYSDFESLASAQTRTNARENPPGTAQILGQTGSVTFRWSLGTVSESRDWDFYRCYERTYLNTAKCAVSPNRDFFRAASPAR